MVKKSKGWDFNDMQESLVKDTERRIEQGFEAIKRGDGKDIAAPSDTQGTVPVVTSANAGTSKRGQSPCVPQAATATVVRTARMFHKERTQDVLVHCPESLHRRLRERKDHIWDEYGERVTINNMVIEAIALWLDQQEGKAKVSATT